MRNILVDRWRHHVGLIMRTGKALVALSGIALAVSLAACSSSQPASVTPASSSAGTSSVTTSSAASASTSTPDSLPSTVPTQPSLSGPAAAHGDVGVCSQSVLPAMQQIIFDVGPGPGTGGALTSVSGTAEVQYNTVQNDIPSGYGSPLYNDLVQLAGDASMSSSSRATIVKDILAVLHDCS